MADYFVSENGWSVEESENRSVRLRLPNGDIAAFISDSGVQAFREWFGRDNVGETEESGPRMTLTGMVDSDWIGRKVRVRAAETFIIEDKLTQVTHLSGVTRLYFENTKNSPGLSMLGQDTGYRVDGNQVVEEIE